jgi:hypothetical protein
MVTIYDQDKDGNRIVVYDSRWRFPELLGYTRETHPKEYKAFQELWERVTGRKIPVEGEDDEAEE